MRWIAALLTGAAAVLLSGTALADDGQQILFGAAFSDTVDFSAAVGPTLSAGPRVVTAGGFSTTRYQPGQGLVRWTSGEVASFVREGVSYFDTVRFSTEAVDPTPGFALLRPGADGEVGRPRAFDVTYLRKWPSVVSVGKGRLTVDITPHAGLGVSSGGRQAAEAGALVRMMKALGVHGAQAPSWYVYGGYRKRSVGLSLLGRDDTVRRDRLSDDGTTKEVQAGFGARRGRFHALLGYTHDRVIMRSFGGQTRDDDRVGLNLLIR